MPPIRLAILLGLLPAGPAFAAPPDEWHTWPIDVSGLPADCRCVVASTPLDLTALVRQLGVEGAADGHSIRLTETQPGGGTRAVDAQWRPDAQPRAKPRDLLPATTRAVSYTFEHDAASTPPMKVSGTLTWIVAGPARRGIMSCASGCRGRGGSRRFPTTRRLGVRVVHGRIALRDRAGQATAVAVPGRAAPGKRDAGRSRPAFRGLFGADSSGRWTLEFRAP